jgi:hypothetical protein
MFKKHPALVGLIVVMLLSFGCGRGFIEPTPLDRHWGESFERAKISQQLDPDASQNLEPVTGLDGQAAEGDMQKYREAHTKDKGSCGGSGSKILLGTLGLSSGQN